MLLLAEWTKPSDCSCFPISLARADSVARLIG
jgi:hypothetical protein